MGQNRPKFRVLYADKHTGLKKGPPPPVVANMSHEDIIPSGTLKTTSTFESQPLLWVEGRKGPVQSGPDGRLLKFVLTFFLKWMSGAPLICTSPKIECTMSHSQMLGKVESGGGPIFKVVLEC